MKKLFGILALAILLASVFALSAAPVFAGAQIPQYLCGMDGVTCFETLTPDCDYCLVWGQIRYSDDPAIAAVQKAAVLAKVEEMTAKQQSTVPTPPVTSTPAPATKSPCLLDSILNLFK